jgi:hypothetical protein
VRKKRSSALAEAAPRRKTTTGDRGVPVLEVAIPVATQ